MLAYENHRGRGRLLVDLLTLAVTVVLVAYLVHYHADLIAFPYQWEYREGAPLIQVKALLRGTNIYALKELPVLLNVYGWLHTFIYAAISEIVGATLPHLRAVSAGCIWGALLICFWHIAKLSGDVLLALVLCAGLYLQWLHYVIPLARPDGLGILVYVTSLVIAEKSTPNFRWALVLFGASIAGFLSKPYFILVGPIAFIYWTLFVSFRKGLALSAIFGVAGVAFIWGLDQVVPTYLSSVLFSQLTAATRWFDPAGWAHLWFQLKTYLLVTSVLWLLLATLIVQGLLRAKTDQEDVPVFGFHLCALAVVSLVLVLKLGQSDGAYLTYFFELASPTLVFAIARLWPLFRAQQAVAAAGKALAIIIFGYSAHLILMPESSRELWKQQYAAAAIATHPYRIALTPPILAGYLEQTGRQAYDTGQNEYLGQQSARAGNPFGLGVPASALREVAADFDRSVERSVAEGKFDLIVTDQLTATRSWTQVLQKSYSPVNELQVGSWRLRFWTRRIPP